MSVGGQDLGTYLTVFMVSCGISLLVVATKKWHIGFTTRREDGKAVQAAHSIPTPRIGGIGIFLAVLFALVFAAPENYREFCALFALSVLPVFLTGLAEDLGFRISPKWRLGAAAVSSLLVISLLGMWLPRIDVPLMDAALRVAPFGIVFTIFATTGVCHAINLVDGLNGLAAMVGLTIAFSLAAIASRAGDPVMMSMAFLLVPALLGFLVLNFPRGTIFLGDAGAYFLGHVLVWLAIFILSRSPEVSPWAILLIFFWPVADTVFAIYRRRRAGKPTDQPDRLHFHQMVMRSLEIAFLGKKRRRVANPLATLVLLPFVTAPAITGVLAWNNSAVASLAVLFYLTLFLITYGLGIRLARRRATLPVQSRAILE